MKRMIALLFVTALLLSLCACGFIPEEVKEQAKEEIGDSFEQSLKDLKSDLKDLTDILAEEVENRLSDTGESLSQELKDSITDAMLEMDIDLLNDTNFFTTKVAGKEYASLLNFPHAKALAVLNELPIGTKFPDPAGATNETFSLIIDGEEVLMQSRQCYAFARYVQHKLYGEHDTRDLTPSSNFYNILDDYTSDGNIPAGSLTEDLLKTVITAAGPGTHLRTNGNSHSMFVVQVDEKGFTIIDANADGDMMIRQIYYTWEAYMSDIFAPRGFKFVRIYDPKE